MAGLVPAIHVLPTSIARRRGCRHESASRYVLDSRFRGNERSMLHACGQTNHRSFRDENHTPRSPPRTDMGIPNVGLLSAQVGYSRLATGVQHCGEISSVMAGMKPAMTRGE